MRRVTCVVVALALVAAGGCRRTQTDKVKTLQEATGDQRLALTLTHGPLRSHAKATWQLIFTNVSHQDVQITFRTSQRAEVILVDKHGKVAYQWSKGQAFSPTLATTSIGPGKRLGIDLEGVLSVPAGSYQVRAGMASTPAPKPVFLQVHVSG